MRLQRYAVFLSGLNYEIQHRPAAHNANADSLSRLPLPTERTAVDTTDKLQVNMLHELPIDHTDIRRNTQKDTVLSRVYTSVQTGEWPETKHEFEPYYRRRFELSTQLGCLLWGGARVYPTTPSGGCAERVARNPYGDRENKGTRAQLLLLSQDRQ